MFLIAFPEFPSNAKYLMFEAQEVKNAHGHFDPSPDIQPLRIFSRDPQPLS
jgi:hypothetical protein